MDEKLERLTGYIQQFPSRKEGYYILSTYYKESNLFEDAKKYLIKAIDIDPDFFGAYIDLIELFLLEDNIPQADTYTTKIINRNPEVIDYYFVITKLFKRFNQLDLALAYLKIPLSIRIYNYELFKEIADLHFLLKNYDKAIIFYNRALNINQFNPIIIFHQALCYFFMNKFDKSIEILQEYSKTQKLTEEMLLFLSNLKDNKPEYTSDISPLIQKAYLIDRIIPVA